MNKQTSISANTTYEEETKKLTKKEKVLIGVAVISTCVAGYFGIKYINDGKKIKELTDDTNTLMSAASEGLFNEALATVGRKIAYRKDKEEYLLKQLDSRPKDYDLFNRLEAIRSELNVLTERQNKFMEAQKLYEIKDPADI